MKRYLVGSEGPLPTMIEDKDGRYVLFSEVEAEIAALSQDRMEWMDKAMEISREHCTLQLKVKELEAQVTKYREVSEKVFNVGHNDNCIFCGFKDKIIQEALKEDEMNCKTCEYYWLYEAITEKKG